MKAPALATLLALTSAGMADAAPGGLAQFQWNKRVLVVFANASDPHYIRQKSLLDGQAAGLAERDMLVLRIDGDTVGPMFGTADTIDAAAIRRDAGVDGTGFQVVLIGKDGGVKLRKTTVVSDSELFGLVDSMPMRAREMR